MPEILILGGGGREHALGWLFARDPLVKKVWFAPGNGGTALEPKGTNLSIDPNKREEWPKIAQFIEENKPQWVVIGPEDPIALGLTDYLQSRGLDNVFAPTKENALLESDKFFSHRLMEQLKIPRAEGIPCTDTDSARRAIRELFSEGIVLKARGLAKGKGVSVCQTVEEADRALEELTKKFGPHILVSRRLKGREFSLFALLDGSNWTLIPAAVRDYKPAFDGDRGPNTGGMGSFAPHQILSPSQLEEFAQKIFPPIAQYFVERGKPYRGFLYAGGILTDEGPKILEFNIRMGDPETQALAPLLRNSPLQLIEELISSRRSPKVELRQGYACCVIAAARGYPESPQKGFSLPTELIELPKVAAEPTEGPTFTVFHSGTEYLHEAGRLIARGGRVLGFTAYHPDSLGEARALAYGQLSKLNLPPQLFYRTDIAL